MLWYGMIWRMRMYEIVHYGMTFQFYDMLRCMFKKSAWTDCITLEKNFHSFYSILKEFISVNFILYREYHLALYSKG